MSFRIDGPGGDEIDAVIRGLTKTAKDEIDRILLAVGAGAVSALSKAYEEVIYNTPPGVFGRPKDSGKPLVQAVQMEAEPDGVTVFTTKKEAVYVEFGTGIFSTVGPGGPIRPKASKRLAFPVWTLPDDFGGFFIPREDVDGPLEFGAIGLVLAKEVAGMRARPVWTNPAVLKAIDKILDREIKDSGAFK